MKTKSTKLFIPSPSHAVGSPSPGLAIQGKKARACVAAAHLTAALWVNTRILGFQGQEELLLGI